MSVKELANYLSYPKTRSCYLDGRYVYLVLKEYKNFCSEHINIHLAYDKHNKLVEEKIWSSDFIRLKPGMNIIRVVIKTSYKSHAALLWLDTEHNTAFYTDIKLEGDKDEELIPNMIKKYINIFGTYRFSSTEYVVPHVPLYKQCDLQGYCNAYIIKEVVDWHSDKDFDTNVDILRFAGAVEELYGYLIDKHAPPDVEYHGGGLGLGLGLLGGIAIGSAISK